jgi:hypothetical protein
MVFTRMRSLIRLYGFGVPNRSTGRKLGSQSGAGYAVTASKTLEIYASEVTPTTASQVDVNLAQIDNDMGLNTTTAFTNPVHFGSEASGGVQMICAPGTAGQTKETAVFGKVTAGKYLGINISAGNAMFTGYGYEVS